MNISKEEANVLMQLLDIACKAGGLGVARACVAFQDKINDIDFTEESPYVPEKK